MYIEGVFTMAHKPYGLNELREMYLKFFETKGHLRLPSFSLVPQNDKSILLINAGMTPHEAPGSPARKSRRATASPPVRSASAPAISKTSAIRPATARILRCWATSPSATTSRRKPFPGRGNSSPAPTGSASSPTACIRPSSPATRPRLPTTRPLPSGAT